MSGPGDEKSQIGDMLGEWDSQLEKGESHITEFVSLGPKVYSYTTNTGRIEMKCKGLSQNGYTEDILEWDENEKKMLKTGKKLSSQMFTDLLSNHQSMQTFAYPDSIKRDGKSQKITSVTSTKTLQKVYDKRIMLSDFSTMPYGTKY